MRELLVNHVAAFQPLHHAWRIALLRRSGVVVGSRVIISSHGWWGGPRVSIGDDVNIAPGFFVDDSAPVRIGDRVGVGPGVRIITGSHEIGELTRGRRAGRAGANTAAPVVVDDDCWLGAGVTVLPGVHVARGCIVGAGSVVTRSTEPHGVYAGVPARRLRDLPPGEPAA